MSSLNPLPASLAASLASEDSTHIALTGASSFLGGLLLKRLVETPSVREVHVFDVKTPVVTSSKLIFHRIDLTRDNADAEVAAVLKANGIRLFIHGALFSGPQRNASKAREVESIGTFQVLNAVAEAGIKRLLVLSDTFVYGALPSHPNFLTESMPVGRGPGPEFVRTRAEVEKQIQEFSADYPQCATCVLRFAPILGPTSSNARARYFLVGLVPKVLGYDPLLQFIHEDDALRAGLLAAFSTSRGTFNIVGTGVLPLSTGIHMAGRIPLPVAG
ncbi:MAG: NAD-dependent epimerase/dehydratase family protein, partial [Silvanigrellales bacterium]|nr:NAD-dependent epimerase/dehydratase family protein [Silvanigrellales bacterium]